ncbi:helix-turn-helix domain-containing protein [Halomarina salina]|uniref:Helix-turn-helix domain-containing protein n=1 Tax=Halomarina salina TaxID=1872699 RepID=A0ABD5RHD4_9EURY|nr:helix-turn-helix domain-containing protein [Halomarina salina]
MQRVLMVCVLALLLALQPLTAVAGTTPANATQQEFEREEFTIHVSENGSARWTFSYKRVLSSESEREQFEAYAEEFNGEETRSYRNFVARAEALVGAGANETGREMNATGFSKEAYVRTGVNDLGVVEMSFRWNGFAAQSGDRVTVGDVFEGGLTLAPNQTLIVTWDEGLAPTSVDPDPRQATDNALVWQGRTGGAQFLDQQPRVVFGPATGNGSATPDLSEGNGSGPNQDAGGGDGSGLTTDAAGSGGGSDLPVWPFAFGAIVLVALGGLAFRHGYLDDEFDDGDATGASDGGDGGGDGRAGASDGGSDTPPTEQTGEETSEPPEPAITDEELMSDDDRVHSLLAENGGRMKQVNIVERTGWSKSKVSMLLSEMEEEGEIHKLRVGRENIISRTGDEPNASRPTFDDE